MDGIAKLAPAIVGGAIGGAIGFGVGGPAGVLAGAAGGIGIVDGLFPKIQKRIDKVTDDAQNNLDAAQKAVIAGIEKTSDATVGLIEHVGKLWAPIYLGSLLVNGLTEYSEKNHTWYVANCEKENSSFGNDIQCGVHLVGGITATCCAIYAMYVMTWKLNEILTGKDTAVQVNRQ